MRSCTMLLTIILENQEALIVVRDGQFEHSDVRERARDMSERVESLRREVIRREDEGLVGRVGMEGV